MKKLVGVSLTFGRQSVCELVAMWQRQRLQTPLFLWIDDAPALDVSDLPEGVYAAHGGQSGRNGSIGVVRHAAMMAAIERFALTLDDALIVLDDDDYYSPEHAQACALTLARGPFVAGRRFGLQRDVGEFPPYLFAPDNFPDPGMGTHATWAFTVGKYLDAGGYRDAEIEDVDLFERLGGAVLHSRVTHVRRQYGAHLSITQQYDRASMRAASACCTRIVPHHMADHDQYASWCAAQNA